MRYKSSTVNAFYALVKAGLWPENTAPFISVTLDSVDWEELYQLASEQSVLGLMVAGLERSEAKPPEPLLLQWMGELQMLEQRNLAMNYFIGVMVDKMYEAGIETILVKGQGVAQCYNRPLWRSCGDVDFFLDEENYEKAKSLLFPLASDVDPEERVKKHQAMTIDPWIVELHGLMPTEISERINREVYRVQQAVFTGGGTRVWKNDAVDVLLPSPDNDVVIVFTHFLQHFFVGGVGLRQICDWCRLLWTFRSDLDLVLLEHRLQRMGILSEWRVFAAFAVSWLGAPKEAMPFYDSSGVIYKKTRRVCAEVLEAGNFGHNKDNSYRSRYPMALEKFITFYRRLCEFVRLTLIFPLDAPRFFFSYVKRRVKGI